MPDPQGLPNASQGTDTMIGLDLPPRQAVGLRVAVVHDYLTQRGGAERVVLSLMEAFPGARLVTSVYQPEETFPEFKQYAVETTWLDRVPMFRADPRRAMPLLPTVFSGVQLDDVDVVVCSSSGWAHGVTTTAPKIVYCHNPARWLYQRHEYVESYSPIVRAMVTTLSPALKWWDRRAAKSVTTYLANSRSVADRVSREYAAEAIIVPPAVVIDPADAQEPVPGIVPGFLLTVGRARGYKNVEIVCESVEGLPGERLVVVGGLPDGDWSGRLVGVTDISDAQLRWLYAHCSAVVAASFEDFGLTPVEGYVFGKPALCLRAGGFLDTMRDGVTGHFFELEITSIQDAISRLRAQPLPAEPILAHGSTYGFDAFRDRLVTEAELALASRGLDPLAPQPSALPLPQDHVEPLRRPITAAAITLLLLTLLSTGMALQVPALWPVASLLGVATLASFKIRLALRRRPTR